jgi:hypothetical protein
MAIEHLVEEVFCIKENVALSIKLLPFLPEEQAQDKAFIYTVYPRGNPTHPIYAYAWEGAKDGFIVRDFKKELEIYLRKYNPTRLIDFLSFITTFDPVNTRPSVYGFEEYKITPDPVIDDILKDSPHNFLLYDFQLEQLLSLFNHSEHPVVWMCRQINRKEPSFEHKAKRLTFSNGQNILEVFKERAIVGATVFPTFGSAKSLMEAVNL